MQRLLAIFGAVAVLPVLAGSEIAEGPPILGHTTAGPTVTTGIRSFFSAFRPLYLDCAHIDSLTAEDVPSELLARAHSFKIPASLMPPPEELARVELWTASGCEHSMRVLIRLWYSGDGTEQFAAIPLDQSPNGS